MLPDFVIIGAMKCGTSSLFRYLASHPDIVPSATKETDFFKTEKTFARGLGWYEGLFRGEGAHAVEASPNYTKRTFFPGVPERMHSVVPSARLIYILRDPVARAVSHYVHNLIDGRETRSFSEAILDPAIGYIQTSRYHFQLQAFLERYPAEQVHLVQAEELDRDPVGVVHEVCRSLGVPPDCDPAVLGQRFHETSEKRKPCSLERVIRHGTRSEVIRTGAQRLLRPLGTPVSKPVITAEDREVLRAHLAPDIEELCRFAGREFPGWSITGS